MLAAMSTVTDLAPTRLDLFRKLEQILPPCPRCDSSDHRRCRFEAGSLYCYTHSCANPHHRSKA